MDRDAKKMRGDGPTVFAQVKNMVGVADIADYIFKAREAAGVPPCSKKPKTAD